MGEIYEQLEYTPYGELWVEHVPVVETTPFRFTGKERDGETGLYYYGARYLNPQTGMWLSADPAMGEYIPQAPINDEAKKHNENLPGMGGMYNYVNLHAYHYAGNNPVVLRDPTGKIINKITYFDYQDSTANSDLNMGSTKTYDTPGGPANTIGNYGCLFTAIVNIGNTVRRQTPNISPVPTDPVRSLSDYNEIDSYYPAIKNTQEGIDRNMNDATISALLKDMTGRDFKVKSLNKNLKETVEFFSGSKMSNVFIVADIREGSNQHWINITGVDSEGNMIYHNTHQGDESRREVPYNWADLDTIKIIYE